MKVQELQMACGRALDVQSLLQATLMKGFFSVGRFMAKANASGLMDCCSQATS